MLGFAAITGRIIIGLLLDQMEGRVLAAIVVCLPVLTCSLLIATPGSVAGATAAILFLGLALGAEYDIVAYLTSRYFSLQNFGLLFGTLVGITTFAGITGPILLSAVYDSTKSYLPALWIALPLLPISALLFLLLGPYPGAAAIRHREGAVALPGNVRRQTDVTFARK